MGFFQYGEEYVSKAASQKYERERHNGLKSSRVIHFFITSVTKK